ncbi:hypothetical protein RND71_030660 [Anisodus tanguticus]|uniref:Uncharacterized protein n=1 Tax=Anisodus tanguticus TaxID=243964 RepID=A0AAE1RIL6_9SOLA|nr:hypothetical protein RND71_030660 [Anisodus tanguticus]
MLIHFVCSTNRSISTLTFTQLGIVMFAFARSTVIGFPTTEAIGKTTSLARCLVVPKSGLNQGFYMSGLIW